MKTKEIFRQVLHKKDGGRIILVSTGINIVFICEECKQVFELNLPVPLGISSDFTLYKPEIK